MNDGRGKKTTSDDDAVRRFFGQEVDTTGEPGHDYFVYRCKLLFEAGQKRAEKMYTELRTQFPYVTSDQILFASNTLALVAGAAAESLIWSIRNGTSHMARQIQKAAQDTMEILRAANDARRKDRLQREVHEAVEKLRTEGFTLEEAIGQLSGESGSAHRFGVGEELSDCQIKHLYQDQKTAYKSTRG